MVSRSKGSRSQLLQTTNPLIARPLSESPNSAWLSCAGFGANAFPLLVQLMSYIAAVGTMFNVFSYDAVWVGHQGRASSIEAELRPSGTRTTLQRPGVEPITYPCRVDTLRVMQRTRVTRYKIYFEQITN